MRTRASRVLFYLAAAFAFVMAVLPKPPQFPGEPSDKVLHVLAFLVLGSLAAAAFPQRSARSLILFLGLYGAAIELVQMVPVLHRDSEFVDLLADVAAAAVAIGAARLLIMRNR